MYDTCTDLPIVSMSLQVHACSLHQSPFQAIHDTGVVLMVACIEHSYMDMASQIISSCKVQLLFIYF